MATRKAILNAYATAEDCLEEAYSLLRRAKKAVDAIAKGKSCDEISKEAGNYASGLRTKINAAPLAINEDVLSFAAAQVKSRSSCLQRTFDLARQVNAELLHLLQKQAAEQKKTDLSHGQMIRSFFPEVAKEFLASCDFDKDKALNSLNAERNSVAEAGKE
jgi:pyruvate/oxaloacetate carboxyltransferase